MFESSFRWIFIGPPFMVFNGPELSKTSGLSSISFWILSSVAKDESYDDNLFYSHLQKSNKKATGGTTASENTLVFFTGTGNRRGRSVGIIECKFSLKIFILHIIKSKFLFGFSNVFIYILSKRLNI